MSATRDATGAGGGLAPRPRSATLGALFDAVRARGPSDVGLGEDVAGLRVTGLSLDSRTVRPGDLYLALPGRATHGLVHAGDAVRRGAVAIATVPGALDAHPDARGAAPLVEIDGLAALAGPLARAFHDAPDTAMKLVAVTGTDGKTSVCRFVAEALAALGGPAGYIGTIGWGLVTGSERTDRLEDTALTTPDAVELVRMLAALRDAGARTVALEASSHGIAEGRLDGTSLDVAVLTNLGRDHLDYHGTVEAYAAAKARLFDMPGLSAAVLNADDALGRDVAAALRTRGAAAPAVTSFSARGGPADVRASDIVQDASGLAFTLGDGAARLTVHSTLLGRFNVENLLACHAVLRALGHGAERAAAALGELRPVPGRMQRVAVEADDRAGPTGIVDFAHTPGALAAAIAATRAHCQGRLHVVFGCGGDRDPGKRAPMARAAEAADSVIVTDDNPRTERPEAIVADIVAGLSRPDAARVVHDRARAIELAVAAADDTDVVLVAGKGHESYQVVGTERRDFDDREALLAALVARAASRSGAAA